MQERKGQAQAAGRAGSRAQRIDCKALDPLAQTGAASQIRAAVLHPELRDGDKGNKRGCKSAPPRRA